MFSPCPICKNKAHRKWSGTTTPDAYFSNSQYSIAASAKPSLPTFECPSCHHGFVHPLPNESQLSIFYNEAPADKSFIQEETGRRHTAKSTISKIKTIKPNSHTLIDLGCGPGLFLSEAAKASFNTHGIETSDWAYEFATNDLNLPNIHKGNIDIALNLPAQSFDVVTAFDLIEHLSNPTQLIQIAKHLLKPNGLLVLTTPRFDSFTAKASGQKWHALFPEHLHYFSYTSLNQLLSAHDFTIIKKSSHTRHFSVNYLLSRTLRRPISLPIFPFNQVLPINLGDELEIYASLK